MLGGGKDTLAPTRDFPHKKKQIFRKYSAIQCFVMTLLSKVFSQEESFQVFAFRQKLRRRRICSSIEKGVVTALESTLLLLSGVLRVHSKCPTQHFQSVPHYPFLSGPLP